ncbi:MAG: ABC transporter ATP-binding protein [Pseudobdellovibrionaceae bacterium]
MSQIQFNNVSKKFGTTSVVKNLNFKIEDGEFVSFLGPSGCGKTTTLRMIAGLETNSDGQITLDGEVFSDAEKNIFIPPENRNIGMVFQSYAIWPHMNVFENVAFPLKMKKIKTDQIRDEVGKILTVVGLDNLAKRMPDQLSGGQQQRVALARGLVMKPRVLLLDEPLSNLDTKLREKMRRDIRKLQKDFSLTAVYVTHDQKEAETMSDRIVVMNHGVIEQIGTFQELQSNPKSEFVKDFLSAH